MRYLLTIILLVFTGAAYAAPPDYPLLTRSQLVYQGAFKLPHGTLSGAGGSFANASGRAMSYDPTDNGLNLTTDSSAAAQYLAKVQVPATFSKSATLADLLTASVLLNPIEITGGYGCYVGVSGANKCTSGSTLIGHGVLIGGTLVSGSTLYGSTYVVYDSGTPTANRSHFKASADYSSSAGASGMYTVGGTISDSGVNSAGFVGGYMASIPTEWRSYFGGHTALTGQASLAIIQRTSLGPSAHAFSPADIGDHGTEADPVPASPLVYYLGGPGFIRGHGAPGNIATDQDDTYYLDQSANVLYQLGTGGAWDNLGTWNGVVPSDVRSTLGAYTSSADSYYSKTYSQATEITGVVFPSGTRSVLFFGRQPIGRACYGTGTWIKDHIANASTIVDWLTAQYNSNPSDTTGWSCGSTHIGNPSTCGSDPYCGTGNDECCYDPAMGSSSKGVHGYPYRYMVWAYDAMDLVAVYNDTKEPWQIEPYAVWDLTDDYSRMPYPVPDKPADVTVSLTNSPNAGALTMTVDDASALIVSDGIQINSGQSNYEYNVIRAISDNTVTLAYPLQFSHSSSEPVLRHVIGGARLLGAAYDSANQRVFISAANADSTGFLNTSYPLIHVYSVTGAESPPAASLSTTPSVAAGRYATKQTVALSCNESGTIRYSLDGSAPTLTYSGALTVKPGRTLKYYCDDGVNQEAVKSAVYAWPRRWRQ
jgi:hypothetical protein